MSLRLNYTVPSIEDLVHGIEAALATEGMQRVGAYPLPCSAASLLQLLGSLKDLFSQHHIVSLFSTHVYLVVLYAAV